MRYAHNVTLSVFSKEGEEITAIRAALIGLTGLDMDKEKLTVKDTVVKGHDDRDIHILEIVISKEGAVNRFIKNFIARLSEDQRNLMVSQRESRVDDDCHFFIRIDKRKLLEEERLWITDSGNCFHIRFALAAYPVKKEVGVRIVKDIFSASSLSD